jgi:hypothetical protein
VASAFVNVSKAGMVISLALLLILCALHVPAFWRAAQNRGRWRSAAGAILLAGGLAVLVVAGGWHSAWARWQRLPGILADNPRATAVEVAWKMIPGSGALGFGAGTFGIAFPHYTGNAGDRIRGVWRFLHQDYLQTVIEWGWIGAVAWAILIFGGAGLALWHGLKKGAPLSEARPLYLAAALAIGATALHATVDFPFQIASLQLYLFSFTALGWSAWFRR